MTPVARIAGLGQTQLVSPRASTAARPSAGATGAVKTASIAIDLVSAIRSKGVDAYQNVMRMQV